MNETAQKIKQIEGLRSFGATVSEAIGKALGTSLSEFAERHGFARQEVSMCLNAYHQRTYPEIRDALCEALSVPREYLDRLIDEQKPAEEGAA